MTSAYNIGRFETKLMRRWYSTQSSGIMLPTEPGWIEIFNITPTSISAYKTLHGKRIGIIHTLRKDL